MRPGAAHRARRHGPADTLAASFYERETELVAREMLGAVLESHTSDGIASGRIVETEAYLGEHDPACHAAVGRTARTLPLYGPPGSAYVYFVYGMHWCVNAVTRGEGLPSAVLIRAIEPLEGVEIMRRRRSAVRRDEDLTSGPARLCRALGITGDHNRLPLQAPPLLVRRGLRIPDEAVSVTARIGITKAAEWPLRWIVTDSPFVSGRPLGRRARRR